MIQMIVSSNIFSVLDKNNFLTSNFFFFLSTVTVGDFYSCMNVIATVSNRNTGQ